MIFKIRKYEEKRVKRLLKRYNTLIMRQLKEAFLNCVNMVFAIANSQEIIMIDKPVVVFQPWRWEQLLRWAPLV
jgi:hypothetical protein